MNTDTCSDLAAVNTSILSVFYTLVKYDLSAYESITAVNDDTLLLN